MLLGLLCAGAPALAAAETGRELYARHCWFCHGQQGDGLSDAAAVLKPRPRDFTDPRAVAELTLERIVHSITKGRPGTAMPAFGATLTAGEIRAVAHYIRDEIMSGVKIERFYPAHARGSAYIDFSRIGPQTDLRPCLLHCHTDERFIRQRLKRLRRRERR